MCVDDISDESLTDMVAELGTATDEDADEDWDVAANLALRAQGDSFLLRHLVDCHEVSPFESLNDALAVVPLQGHEVWVASNPCVTSIAIAFIADPTASPDLSCLEERKAKFVQPDSVSSANKE